MEKNSPLISVIIPMYNSSETIEKALDSIKNQTYQCNYQILIINDGSTDNSKDVVEKYIISNPKMNIILLNQENSGVSKARNSGLKLANGSYIAFLDSDDEWKAQKIEKQIQCFTQNKKIDFLGTNFDSLNIFRKELIFQVSFYDLLFKNYFQPSTILMKKEIVDRIGFFNENQTHAEEGNYFFRISQIFNCYLLNESLIIFGSGKKGFGESGLSSNLYEMEKGELKNIYFAYKQHWIGFFLYIIAILFSLLKYFRRIIISKFNKLYLKFRN